MNAEIRTSIGRRYSRARITRVGRRSRVPYLWRNHFEQPTGPRLESQIPSKSIPRGHYNEITAPSARDEEYTGIISSQLTPPTPCWLRNFNQARKWYTGSHRHSERLFWGCSAREQCAGYSTLYRNGLKGGFVRRTEIWIQHARLGDKCMCTH